MRAGACTSEAFRRANRKDSVWAALAVVLAVEAKTAPQGRPLVR